MIEIHDVDSSLYDKEVTYWIKIQGEGDVLLWEGPVDGIIKDGTSFHITHMEPEAGKILHERKMTKMIVEPSWSFIDTPKLTSSEESAIDENTDTE